MPPRKKTAAAAVEPGPVFQTMLRLDPGLREQLDEVGAQTGGSRNALINAAIRHALAEPDLDWAEAGPDRRTREGRAFRAMPPG